MHCESDLFQKVKNPRRCDFERYLGREIVVGLKGVDENNGGVVMYLKGIVGKQDGKLALYEFFDDGRFINPVMPIDSFSSDSFSSLDSIAEVLLPMDVVSSEASYFLVKEKAGLSFIVKNEPNNPNSNKTSRLYFKL